MSAQTQKPHRTQTRQEEQRIEKQRQLDRERIEESVLVSEVCYGKDTLESLVQIEDGNNSKQIKIDKREMIRDEREGYKDERNQSIDFIR